MKTRRFSQSRTVRVATAVLTLGFAASLVGPAPTVSAAGRASARLARPASLRMELTDLLRQTVAGQHFSGVVLVQRGADVLLRQGYGRDDSPRHPKNTPATTVPLPGLTPIFSIAAAERLVEQGKLSLQSPITRYLPGPASWHSITVGELINRTSGIPDPLNGSSAANARIRTVADFLAAAARQPLQFVPGTHPGQSITGFVALLPIIERASGESYAAYLRQFMFRPLGLTHTTVHETTTGGRTPALANPWMLAVTGITSSADELDRYDQAVLGCSIVSPESLFWALQASPRPNAPVNEQWVIQVAGRHGSISAGERIFPYANVTIIVLSNSGANVQPLMDQMEDLVFGR